MFHFRSSGGEPRWITLPAEGTVIDELTTYADSVQAETSLPVEVTYSINPEAEALGIVFTPDGQFSWTPTEIQGPDSYQVTFSATNGTGTVDSTITIVVNEVNLAPELAPIADQLTLINSELTFTAMATDPDTLAPEPFTFNRLTYTIEDGQPGMAMDSSGVFTWAPATVGNFTVNVVVNDNGNPNESDEQLVNIIVENIFIPNSCPAEELTSVFWTNLFDDQGQSVVDSVTIEISAFRDNFNPPRIAQGASIDSTFTGTLEATLVDLSSLDVDSLYYWRVIAQVGDEELVSIATPFRRWAAQISVQHTLPFQSANKSADFRMISLPGAPQIEIGGTFNGTQAAPGPLPVGGNWDWSVWEDDASDTPYSAYLGNATLSDQQFEPGVGYWAISTSSWTVPQTPVANVTLEGNAFYPIPLNTASESDGTTGWTMIGNPFNFPVAWADIVGSNPNLNEEIWEWNGTEYVQAVCLEPYKGYYHLNTGGSDRIDLPCNLEPAICTATAKQEPALKGLKLALSQDRDPVSPTISDVHVSLHEQAVDGLDKFDVHAPPPLFESYRISLISEELDSMHPYFKRTARNSFDEAQSYNLQLKSVPDEPIYLHVSGLEHITNNEVYLFDEALGKSYNLKEAPVVLFETQRELSSLRLVIGDAAYIQDEESKLLPDDFVMQQSYPNPFVHQTTIEYSLPEAEFVTLDVYNMLGQRVRSLVNAEQSAGHHSILWDGKNEAGESVASGVYLYVFTSPSHRATERLVRIK